VTGRRFATSWIADVDRARGPLYLAIANAIAGAIGRGDLLPGDRLPPHRNLAAALDVDLTTVTRAYTEARRRGLLDGQAGRGTFVQAASPLGGELTSVVDMSMNLPPQPRNVRLDDLLRDGIARLLRHEDVATLMAYRAGAGTASDRAAGAAWLAPVLGPVHPARVLVCPGAQSAMLAVLSTLLRPGEAMVCEPLTYPGLRALASHVGAVLLPVEVDEEGYRPEALDRMCRMRAPRVIYCTPTTQNPTTATMSRARRQAIAEVARRHAIPMIEDDAYGLLPAEPLPAIASLAPEHVFHVATTAKSLTPGLRTAYLVVPGPGHAMRVMAALRASVMMASPLLIGLVTDWIRDGIAASVLEGIRAEAVARQTLARAFLPPELAVAHPEGLHVWLRLPPHWARGDFVTYVRHQGLALVASDAFHVAGEGGGTAPNGVRVSLGVAPDHDRLRDALGALSDALRQHLPPLFAQVV
jgi:DNA-binding transcriptional MocR family regulator